MYKNITRPGISLRPIASPPHRLTALATPPPFRQYNEKAEVYTWAIILWEMTVRERPYTGILSVEVF